MTTNKLKIKKGDEVVVIAGKDKGKKGSVLRTIPSELRVVVSGVNVVKRHTRAGAGGPGGIIAKEAPLHISNVAIADPKSGKPSRVGYKLSKDGKKTRIARASGEAINN